MQIELATPRLTLGGFSPADVVAVYAGCREAEVQRWRAAPPAFSIADAERFVLSTVPAGWADGTRHHWAVRRRGSAALIGVVAVSLIGGEVGFWIDARWRRCGFATEALGAVADHRFAAGQRVLRWECLAGHVASAGVAARLGFTYLGERTHPAPDGGPDLRWWTATLRPETAHVPATGWPTAPTLAVG